MMYPSGRNVILEAALSSTTKERMVRDSLFMLVSLKHSLSERRC